MNIPRIVNYGGMFFNKYYYQFAPVCKAVGLKKWCLTPSSFFSSVCQRCPESNKLTLTPLSHLVECSRGIKDKLQLGLRCKDCYFVRKEGIWYVMCSSYGRHKQRQKVPKGKYGLIITHAFQSKQRPW